MSLQDGKTIGRRVGPSCSLSVMQRERCRKMEKETLRKDMQTTLNIAILQPSTLIYSSLIVMASTCTILLVVVLILHFRSAGFVGLGGGVAN